jgi:D-sedoheptulose 7-phosphate isomerase
MGSYAASMITNRALKERDGAWGAELDPAGWGMPDNNKVFAAAIAEHLAVIEALRGQQPVLEAIATEMMQALLRGNKVLWCGNGGSAADSQHLAAELVGRFRRERRAMPSIALTTDTSILTAIGNDYGYEHVFRRQVEALCVAGDVLVGLSTSGNSRNVCLALEEAHARGAVTVAFTGAGGGAMKNVADLALCVASKDTARIQEGHILCGHMLCDWVELEVCPGTGKQNSTTVEESAAR